MIKTGRYRINRDQRGWITTGKKTEEGYPTTLDHFNVSAFPEVIAAYGEKPESLIVLCPAHSLEEFFDDNFGAWGRNNALKRQCDGVECVHRIKETVNGIQFEQSEISDCVCQGMADDSKERCGYGMTLKMFISHPDKLEYLTPVCYGFKTGSINSGDTIRSELQKMEFLSRTRNEGSPSLAGMPFRLSVRMVSGKDNANKKFPIWSMQAVGFDLPTLPELERPALNVHESISEDAEIVNETGEDAVKSIEATGTQKATSKTKQVISAAQLKRFHTIADKNNWSKEEVDMLISHPEFGFESSKDISRDDYDRLVKALETTASHDAISEVVLEANKHATITDEPKQKDILGDGLDQYGQQMEMTA